jgi:hypothetical protein
VAAVVVEVAPGAAHDVPRRSRRERAPLTSRDATGVVAVVLALLFLIPARLVVPPLGAAGTPAGIAGILLLMWWATARMVPSLGVDRGKQPVRRVLALLAGSIILSYAAAMLHPLPNDEVNGADRGILALAAWAGIGLVTADMLRSRSSVERLLRRVVVLGAVISVIGIVQFAGKDLTEVFKIPGLKANSTLDLVDERGALARVSGTASHAIEFGVVLAMILPFALHVATQATRRKPLWWLATGLILVATPMSVSRSAILGLMAEFILLFTVWSPRRRMIAVMSAPVFLVAMRLLVPGLVGTFASIFSNASSDNSVQGRTDDYSVVGRFVTQSPWIGRGFGTFIPSDFFVLDNQYLGTVVETGFVGLAAVFMVIATAIALGRGIRRRAEDPALAELGQCFVAAFAAAAIAMGTFDALGFPMFTGLFFFLLGCAGALWRLSSVDAGTPVFVTGGGEVAP